MKRTIILAAAALLIHAAFGTEYTFTGKRYLRKYTSPKRSQLYMTEIEVQRIANLMCDVPWTASDETCAMETTHVATNLDENVANRDLFDAALFCAGHSGDEHTAYANAACYRFEFPTTSDLPTVTNLSLTVYSDPYNACGARISVISSDSGTIPTDCATVRGDVADGIAATGVAQRVTRTTGSSSTWYPAMSNVTFAVGAEGRLALPSGGLQLKRYLYVFVLMENYATCRGNWIEGSSYIDNEIRIMTSSPITALTPDCDIAEPYATNYLLKDGQMADDADSDGLSNYSEYLISEVFGFTNLSVTAYATHGTLCDYFQKVGDLYFGEIFQDHDRIDDAFELKYPSAASMYAYDPSSDYDGDGWSNYAEYKAETDPEDPSSYPVPTVRVTVRSTSAIARTKGFNVCAWSDRTDPYMLGTCAASWKLNKIRGTDIDRCEMSLCDDSFSFGHLREGTASFIVWQDDDGGTDGAYDPGEPFGLAQGVDVGWQGAEFDVTLDETSGITPRFDMWSDSTVNDRSATMNEATTVSLADRIRLDLYPESTNYVSTANAQNEKVHVRIVRFGINHIYAYACGVGFGDGDGSGSPDPIVIDRTYEKSGRTFLCEADFLQDGEFDLDWSRLEDEILWHVYVRFGIGRYWVDANGKINADADGTEISAVTNITYLAVLDGGKGFKYWINGVDDTNTVIQALGTPIERRFELVKHAPVAENVAGITYAARPTFRWSLPNEEEYAKAYGTTYTAFKLQIFDADGTTKIYDSGVRRAPAQKKDGSFEWTAEASVCDLVSPDHVFSPTGKYTWRVAMYNAKFKPQTASDEAQEKWSEKVDFAIAANGTHEMNDAGYSAIDAVVRYAGPTAVRSVYQNLSVTNAKVRVQAFATGDFAGTPLAEAVVTSALDAFSATTVNARLRGLPATGTYYLRAYVDSNGNHQLDDWESWGEASEPVTLTTATAVAPVVRVWIEDSDTDGDFYPDSWEFERAPVSLQLASIDRGYSYSCYPIGSGSTTRGSSSYQVSVRKTRLAASTAFLSNINARVSSLAHVNKTLYDSVASSNLNASVSTSGSGTTLTPFITDGATNTIYGIGNRTLPSVEYIRNAVRWRLSQ